MQPQKGPQTKFLESTADIAIFGGAAGGGKTLALLLEPLYHMHNPDFGCVIFRREAKEISSEGGLWDASMRIYSDFGAKAIQPPSARWVFPSGAKISFSHLNQESDMYGWKGSEICLLCFDELTAFKKSQLFYMLSRNRSTCGIRPYVRATTNPDADSWVAKFIGWWIDPETGFPIPERSGVLRYFVTRAEEQIFADSPQELLEMGACDTIDEPKSLTFIAATIYDNQALLSKDRGYLANLKALNTIERARLLDGNWKIRLEGRLLERSYFQRIEKIPLLEFKEIFIDTAQKQKEYNDYTVMQCWGRIQSGGFILLDQIRAKWDATDLKSNAIDFWNRHMKPLQREELRWMNVEDKVSGTSLIQQIRREGRIPVKELTPNKDKVTRLMDVQPYVRSSYIYLPENTPWGTGWVLDFLDECEKFRKDMSHEHDDQVDAMVYAIGKLLAPSDRMHLDNWDPAETESIYTEGIYEEYF